MAVKIIPARIQVNGRTAAEWDESNFIPEANELIVYTVDNEHSAPRLKVGDGVTKVANLPFMESHGEIDIDNIVAKRVEHKLIFGSGEVYEYDGSEEVTVPVYMGEHS